MIIEVLYPEVCDLYGELGNIRYLKKSCYQIEIVETGLNDEPMFATAVPDLIYMGSMTEKSQLIVLQRLRKYEERLRELIEKGARFLITGNALEIFGKKITDKDGTMIDCLGIIDTVASRDMMNRFNSLYLGSFEGMKIVGYKSQFSRSKWEPGAEVHGMFITERGPGLDNEIKEEGVRINNFMATYLIGPLLVLNPPFAGYLLKQCGVDAAPAFEKEAMDAYETRVREFMEPDRGFYY